MADTGETALDVGSRTLLAIDTAIGTSVALGSNGRVWSAESLDPRGHAEAIGVLLERVFAESGVVPEQVDGVVVGIGPGPFTGLRVGIAAAETFATGRDVPLYRVHSHDAAALRPLAGASSRVRVVQDAKRKELFVSVYSGLDWAGVPIREDGPSLLRREERRDEPGDVEPATIPAADLVRIAARRLACGAPFAAEQVLYLREPDVKAPGAVKRVSR